MGVNGEALQLHSVYEKIFCKSCKNPYQYYKSRENPYQVLQVMQESVSVLQVMHAVYEHAMKSKVYMIKIIITIVPSYTGKNITRLLPVALLLVLCTCNNTHSNKLVIFSSIAWYYGDILV